MEIVFTEISNAQSHPMHVHGMNFHVLAQDMAFFNPARDKLEIIWLSYNSQNGFCAGGRMGCY